MTQTQKIRDYTASNYYIDTSSLWNLAWHDSFVRNGLSDFVPPLTDNLNVLIVGNNSGDDNISTGTTTGESEGAEVARMDMMSDAAVVKEDNTTDPIIDAQTETIEAASTNNDDDERTTLAQEQQTQDSSCSFLAAVFDDNADDDDDISIQKVDESSEELDFVSYDCIMDQGLIADILARGDDQSQIDDEMGTASAKNREEMGRLLWEATKRLSDMGIYVANTRGPLDEDTKEYLTTLGKLLGIQWVFDLDGISDENQSVNVGRYSKYLRDELPPGWQSFSKIAKNVK